MECPHRLDLNNFSQNCYGMNMALTMVIVMKMIMDMGCADLLFDVVHLQVHGVWDLGSLWQLGVHPAIKGS